MLWKSRIKTQTKADYNSIELGSAATLVNSHADTPWCSPSLVHMCSRETTTNCRITSSYHPSVSSVFVHNATLHLLLALALQM